MIQENLSFDHHLTLDDAKRKLRENFDRGSRCLCCGQFVKLYKRKLNDGMARFLLALYHLSITRPKDKYFHVTEIFYKRNSKRKTLEGGLNSDYAFLQFWGLIAEKLSQNEKKNSGFWSITELGNKFSKNEATVPKYVRVFDSRFFGFSGNEITIVDCLGDYFNYKELMRI